MYEKGIYPNYSELGKLLGSNYDFEKQSDNKFIVGVDGDYSVFTEKLNFMFN